MNLDWFLDNPITIGQVVRLEGPLPDGQKGFPEKRVLKPWRLATLGRTLALHPRGTLKGPRVGEAVVVAPIGLVARVMSTVHPDKDGRLWRAIAVAQEDLPEAEVGWLPADTICQRVVFETAPSKPSGIAVGATFPLREGLLADLDAHLDGLCWITVHREGDHRVIGYAIGCGDPLQVVGDQEHTLLSYDKARDAWREYRGLPPLVREDSLPGRRRKMDLGPAPEDPEEGDE